MYCIVLDNLTLYSTPHASKCHFKLIPSLIYCHFIYMFMYACMCCSIFAHTFVCEGIANVCIDVFGVLDRWRRRRGTRAEYSVCTK